MGIEQTRIGFGEMVRDRRSGLTGKVIGRVQWMDIATESLIVQPAVQDNGTVPGTIYVPEPSAEVVSDKGALGFKGAGDGH